MKRARLRNNNARFQNNRQLVRIAIGIALILLAFWILIGGNELGERSAFAQALLAGVLLFATWNAIDRSDIQIEKSQRQIDISQYMLEIESRPNLVLHYEPANYKITLTNLGKNALMIKESNLYPLIDIDSEISNLIVKSLESVGFDIPISEHFPELVEGRMPKDYRLSISMYYSGNT